MELLRLAAVQVVVVVVDDFKSRGSTNTGFKQQYQCCRIGTRCRTGKKIIVRLPYHGCRPDRRTIIIDHCHCLQET